MQPAKKNVAKVLSAISMAAAATLAAKSAYAASGILLTPLYGQAQSGSAAGTTDGVFIENSAKQFATATFETISNSGPTTINVPVGDYLFLSVDAVLTGNPNPDGGKFTGATHGAAGATQPANMGMSQLAMTVVSSDTHAASLQPVLSTQIPGNPSYAEGFGYSSTAILNLTNGNKTTGQYVPAWTGTSSVGDTETGFGSAGVNDGIGGGNTQQPSNTTAGANLIGMFSGTAVSTAQSTNLFTNLRFQRMGTGTVTLSPTVDASGSGYWNLSTPGNTNTGAQSVYTSIPISASQIQQLPVLVIQTSVTPTSHAIVSLTAGDAPAANYGSQVGSTLSVVGSNGSYVPVQTSFTAVATGSVEVDPWSPVTDTEVFGVDVASGALGALVAAINSGDANVPASKVVASTIGPSPDPFGSQYNLFLTFSGTNLPGSATDTLGLDLSSTNDALLSGYTFSAVAVVPEPMSLGLLVLGGVGLMARRNRRKA